MLIYSAYRPCVNIVKANLTLCKWLYHSIDARINSVSKGSNGMRKRNYQGVYIGLSQADTGRLDDLVKEKRLTKTEICREALRWYLDNHDELKDRPKETQIALSIKAMTDRICGMLARQGAAVGTLYELTWMGLSSEEAKQAFEAAANKAKQKMRGRLTEDERVVVEKMRKVVNA